MRVAALDCGTNSLRLLVAERQPNGTLRHLDRRMVITRLGQGVDATRRLAPEAMARSVEVLRDFGEAIRAAGCDRVRMAATSAARDATNFDDFRAAAAEAVGVEPELISGTEEAWLSFRGATAELPPEIPCLVVDIGGGSTEFILGHPGADPVAAYSADMGSVRLTEKLLVHDPPLPDELAEAFSLVADHLVVVEAALPVLDARRLVGVAGTITTLAAVNLALDRYDPSRTHHTTIARDDLEALFRRLATETVQERRADPAIDPARADVIAAGALILVAILRRWPFREVLVSESDILDGLAQSLFV